MIRSDDGLALFDSVELARGYLEVPDVEAGVYGPAFDAEGRLLIVELPKELFASPPDSWLRRIRWRFVRDFNPIEVRAAEDCPTHREELIELLTAALGETPGSKSKPADLEDLMARAVDHYGIL